MRGLSILGSTGSIGTSTLEVVRSHPDRFRVVSLSAGRNIELLAEQIREFRPAFVSLFIEEDGATLKRLLGSLVGPLEVGFGVRGASEAATLDGVDMVVSAISGAAGFIPTLSAVRGGKDIALANKETLVLAGRLVMNEARKNNVTILPVDSEHSAVFQSLVGHRKQDLRRIILTASGGPFLNLPAEKLADVTPAEALRHPNWKMGDKITVDSATLMNKGLEVIEARWLFGVSLDKIAVYVHPQSIVHSMVEYIDGSVVAQMGSTDMKGPIAYALAYPERIEAGAGFVDMTAQPLEFREPDLERFPCLALARAALAAGGTMPAAMNAADEVAVDAFLKGRIRFTDIPGTISDVMEAHTPEDDYSVESILEADRCAREQALRIVEMKTT